MPSSLLARLAQGPLLADGAMGTLLYERGIPFDQCFDELNASQPGKVEVPFLAQPPRHYLGAAWYQRDLEIPAAWSGRRTALFLERSHWETTVWIDFARDFQYLSTMRAEELLAGYAEIGRMLGAMIASPEKFKIQG